MPVTPLASKEDFATAVRIALVHRRMTVTELAARLGYARNTVSLAINQGLFRDVRRRIQEELSL